MMNTTSTGMRSAVRTLLKVAQGQMPEQAISIHAMGELVFIPKNGGLRPLLLSSVTRRMALAGLAQYIRPKVQAACGPAQLALGERNGIAKAVHTLQVKIFQHPDWVLMQLDVSKAYPSVRRDAVANAAAIHCPLLT